MGRFAGFHISYIISIMTQFVRLVGMTDCSNLQMCHFRHLIISISGAICSFEPSTFAPKAVEIRARYPDNRTFKYTTAFQMHRLSPKYVTLAKYNGYKKRVKKEEKRGKECRR